jgi:predicted RNA binding protein YcfA (HicA-like mRNA interferase family)
MKVRDLLKHLRKSGCRSLRQTGSHEMWLLPDGNTFPVVVNHLNAEVSMTVLSAARRSLRAAGVPL